MRLGSIFRENRDLIKQAVERIKKEEGITDLPGDKKENKKKKKTNRVGVKNVSYRRKGGNVLEIINDPKKINVDDTEVSGTVDRVIYVNENQDYFVMVLDNGYKVAGNLNTAFSAGRIVGVSFVFRGKWVYSKKYGYTFVFNEADLDVNPIYFFLTYIVKGLGPSLAKKIADIYGNDFEEIMENNPEELLNVKGIGKAKLSWIINSWVKYKEIITLIKFLGPYGVSNKLAMKIYYEFEGYNILKLIKDNPYIITKIRGVGFKTADRIALAMGIKPDSYKRIYALTSYVLEQFSDMRGYTYITDYDIIYTAKKELSLKLTTNQIEDAIVRFHKEKEKFISDNEDIEDTIDNIESGKILDYYNDINLYYSDNELKLTLTYQEYMEKYLYWFFRDRRHVLNGDIDPYEVDEFLDRYEKENNVKLDDKQKEAVKNAVLNRTSVITGYAGTGKTFTVKAIVSFFKNKYPEDLIVGCAMSGIAARRLETVSGIKSRTIHSLLGYNGVDFKYNKYRPLPYKVVILDEASMVNNWLFFKLTKAVAFDTIFIMVGDDAQLPPVGAGDMFHMVLKHNLASSVRLTKIFRQSEDSVLNVFAEQIRKGKIPKGYTKNYYKDWEVWFDTYYGDNHEKNLDTLEKVKEITKEYVDSGKIQDILTDFQVLVPMRKTILGVESLNIQLQNLLNNPDKYKENEKVVLGNKVFCLNDKIVHLVNKDMLIEADKKEEDNQGNKIEKKIRIYNGTLGIITKIDHVNKNVYVRTNVIDDDNPDGVVVIYSFQQLEDLVDLAYCLTVHKAQGSEFKYVVIPLTMSHYIMLNNQWLYTAVTRAKDKVILVGDSRAFAIGCTTKTRGKRKIWLDFALENDLLERVE